MQQRAHCSTSEHSKYYKCWCAIEITPVENLRAMYPFYSFLPGPRQRPCNKYLQIILTFGTESFRSLLWHPLNVKSSLCLKQRPDLLSTFRLIWASDFSRESYFKICSECMGDSSRQDEIVQTETSPVNYRFTMMIYVECFGKVDIHGVEAAVLIYATKRLLG